MPRVIVPELLDSLPHDHPDAAASRRDLRRINALMGNLRWLEREALRSDDGQGLIVEIGAGDGALMRRLCAASPAIAPRCHAIDLAPQPASWPVGPAWHQADLWSAGAGEWLARADIVLANLVLHHFEDSALAVLGSRLVRCRVLLACEPCRRELHVWQGRLLFPVLNRVTRHDMTVSIRAGFRGKELPAALGPRFAGAECAIAETLRGAWRCKITRPTP